MACFVFVAYLIADLCTAARKFVAQNSLLQFKWAHK